MLDQLSTSDGRFHQEKHRSFEIFHRSLQGLNVITFDELLAQARWQVEVAEREPTAPPHTGSYIYLSRRALRTHAPAYQSKAAA